MPVGCVGVVLINVDLDRRAGRLHLVKHLLEIVKRTGEQLFLDVLGDAGNHARSAVGMASLPLDATVEVELILKVK